MPKTTPHIPTSVLKTMGEAEVTLRLVWEMLSEIEMGNMPSRHDLGQMIDMAQDCADDLAALLPDDPDQLDLFAA